MKTLFKWIGISAVVAGGGVLAVRVVGAASAKLAEALRRAEEVTENARQALARTEDALAHAEKAMQGARNSLS